MKELDELNKLKELLDQGAISNEEFQVLKGKILGNTRVDPPKIESPKIKHDMQKQNVATAKPKQKQTKKATIETEDSGWTRIWGGLGIMIAIISGFTLSIRYGNFTAFALPIGLSRLC